MLSGSRKALVYTAMVLSTIQWGISFPLFYIAISQKGAPPMLFATMRFILMVPIILAFLFIRYGPKKVWETAKEHKWILLAFGLTNAALSNIFQNVGLTYTTPAITSIIQTTGPIFVIILAVIFLKEGINRFKVVGIFFTITGSLLLFTGWKFDIDYGSLFGNLLILLSALSYAISSVVAKGFLKKIDPFLLVGLGMTAGAVLLLLNTIFMQAIGYESISAVADFDLKTWIILIYLSIGPGLIALFAWYYMLVHLQVSKQTFFVYIIPIWGVIFSWMIVGDTLSWEQGIYTSIIIVGVVISQIERKKKKEYGHGPILKP